MKKLGLFVPLLALAVCSVAVAEPRAGLFRNASLITADDSGTPVALVGFFHAARGGGYGYGPSCGCDVAAPSCGIEPTCGAGPSCGADPSCGGDLWGGYCAPRCRHHCHLGKLLHHHHRGCNMCDTGCGCDAAPSCGYDSAPACGCGGAHFGHHLCGCGGGGCGGCGFGCGGRCHCWNHGHRFWANGWCGQMVDGFCGSPPDCIGGAVAQPVGPDKAMPQPEAAPPEPMPAEVPAKSTRRPLLTPRFSAKPIGAGLQ